ncbi:MAG: hypothetical protein H8E13_21970 [Actinobacteria bacterium]|nr:hypothetical protein [Actinomycetota bacterium]
MKSYKDKESENYRLNKKEKSIEKEESFYNIKKCNVISNRIKKRIIIKKDGRYLIYYDFNS